jgi:hypothetical protein
MTVLLEFAGMVAFVVGVALLTLWASGSLGDHAKRLLSLTEEDAARNCAPLTTSVLSVTPMRRP